MSSGFGNSPFGFREPWPITEEDTRPLQAMPQPPQKRRGRNRWLLLVLILLGVAAVGGSGVAFVLPHILKHAAPPLALRVIADVPLAGGPTRFDYQSLDPKTGLLFISRPGADSVIIFDTKSNKVVAEVHGVPDAHGVLVIPELGRAYTSAGAKNQEIVINEQTHNIITAIPVGEGPDGLAYDPVDHKIFVSDEDGHSDVVIDVRTNKQIGIIPLSGEAGNTQYDAGSHRIFVNVQTLNQLVAIDPTTDQVIGHYPLPGCQHNHGLNIDAVQRVAFIACDENETLLLMDLRTMKVVDTASVGSRPDVLALDTGRHILYVACESGVVSIFEERATTVHKLKEGYVASFAHTVSVNQETHVIYLPLENVNGKAIIRVAMFQP